MGKYEGPDAILAKAVDQAHAIEKRTQEDAYELTGQISDAVIAAASSEPGIEIMVFVGAKYGAGDVMATCSQAANLGDVGLAACLLELAKEAADLPFETRMVVVAKLCPELLPKR